jgi:hypothetical protein
MKSHISSGRLALSALVCALVVPAHAQSSPSPTEKDLADITARGSLLAGYDQAASQATDAVQALHPPDGKVTRYIAHKTATGWVVDFGRLDPEHKAFLVAYEATQTNGANYNVSSLEPERQDTDFDLAADKAIGLALKDFGGASRPYNVAVLPAGADGSAGLFVYLYPAQVKNGVFPYGGDVRYLVSADGATIVTKRQLHKTVLESTPSNVPNSSTPAAGYHTHALSNLPEDTDVFLVLWREPRIPEYVAAGGHVFAIATDGTIKITK